MAGYKEKKKAIVILAVILAVAVFVGHKIWYRQCQIREHAGKEHGGKEHGGAATTHEHGGKEHGGAPTN